jgi:DNA-binding XRE family transcriptional regulator
MMTRFFPKGQPQLLAGRPLWRGYDVTVPMRRVAEPGLPLKIAFGRAVRRLRTSAGYSAEQLGARAGLSPVDVIAMERGDRNLPLAAIERIAAALVVPVSELLLKAEQERAP